MAPETTSERAAFLVWILVQRSDGITVEEAAQRTGLTWRAAQRLLERISRVVPVYEHNPHGKDGVGVAGRPVRWVLIPLAEKPDE